MKKANQVHMKNAEISTSAKDDFSKSQFVKHDPAPVAAPPAAPKLPLPPARVAPKLAGAAQEAATSTMEETFRAVRATQSTLSFGNFVSLVLLNFPRRRNSMGVVAYESKGRAYEKVEPLRIIASPRIPQPDS